jgi:hypothetical protein
MPQAIKCINTHNPVRSADGGVKRYFGIEDGYVVSLDNRVFTVTNNIKPDYRRCVPMENVYEFQDLPETTPRAQETPKSNDARGKGA